MRAVLVDVDPGGVDDQHFVVSMKRQSPFSVKSQSLMLIVEGSKIDMETIDSPHFTVHMNCQSLIMDPGNCAAHYLHAKHGIVTSQNK